MPFLLIVVGIVLIVSAAKNRQGDLFTLVASDFTGHDNFIFWFFIILLIGAIGYVPKLKSLSTAFLGLIILVLLLSEKGFYASFTKQLSSFTGSGSPTFTNTYNAGVVTALPGSGSSNSTTVISGGGTTSYPVGTSPNGPSSSGCPAGYEYLDSQCVPIDFGSGDYPSDPSDPYSGIEDLRAVL